MLSVDEANYDEIRWQDSLIGASFLVEEAGEYRLMLTNECGALTETIQVNNITVPEITLGPDVTLCEGKTLELTVPENLLDFAWEDSSTDRVRLISEAGFYLLQSSNACGTSFDGINVTVDPCNCFMYVPNAFSPNRDGINDGFGPGFACNLLDYQLIIFDRWGSQVFVTEDANRSWDGTFRGRAVATGTYVYVLNYQFEDNLPAQEQGVVTLVR